MVWRFTGSLIVIGISLNCSGVNLCDIPEVYLAAYKYASDVINNKHLSQCPCLFDILVEFRKPSYKLPDKVPFKTNMFIPTKEIVKWESL